MTATVIPNDDFERSFRLSPNWISVALIGWGTASIVAGDSAILHETRNRLFVLALLLYGLAGLVWLLTLRSERAGRWCAVGGVWIPAVLIVFLVGSPPAVALLPVPVALAAALLSMRSSLATATITSATLLVGAASGMMALSADLYTVAQSSIWILFASLFVVNHTADDALSWASQQYDRAQHLLGEARQRNLELDSILDELVHSNRQLDLLNERLDAMRAHAEAAHQAKSAFIAKVSHEFRTPLNMIIGLTDLVIESPHVYGPLPEALLQDLTIVHRNCTHLSAMVDDVLYLSQAESGRLSLQRSWADLSQELAQAADVVRPLFRQKELVLAVDILDDLPQVYCDATRIRQVFLNLLSNAARYTVRGSVTLSAREVGRQIVVSIHDTGPGISAEELDRIFEPFYQGTTRNGRAQEGTGLGLSICKQFVELHEGQLNVESILGEGTTFTVLLPIGPAGTPPSTATRWITEEWSWRQRVDRPDMDLPPHRPRLILHDENGQLATLTKRSVPDVDIVDATSLEEAIAEAQRFPAHALFINRESSAVLASAIAEIAAAVPDTPAFGWAFPAQAEEIVAAGAMDYLVKPVIRSELGEIIEALEPRPQRILVVDDDDEFRSLLVRMLYTCDPSLEIGTAADGSAALEAMRRSRPDLLFLDIMLPHLTGWQVLAEKEADPTIRPIPAIILSSQDPTDNPQSSPVLVAATARGWSAQQAVTAGLVLSRALLTPA